jgi:hypothetical protein
MRRLVQFGIATFVLAATLFVLAPEKSEAHRYRVRYYYGGPPVVAPYYRAYRPVYAPRYVYRPVPRRVYYYPAPVVVPYYGDPYCW